MKIDKSLPPPLVWDGAHKHFEIDDALTIYTYGDTLHNPAGILIDEPLGTHEGTHYLQQMATIGGPDAWWQRYFIDATFRAQQEVEAYGEQYKAFCALHGDRNSQYRYLMRLAEHLSSPMYKIEMTKGEALRRIKHSPTPLVVAEYSRGGANRQAAEEGRGADLADL